ncbi:MAG: hypothetical protein M3Q49_06785 [Actinomycetota bacterium]|nr:hypothetical protein [Actinomycetota bacterium]MDP9485484.1 hypothetical protein [Actinomycetota bacterium]
MEINPKIANLVRDIASTEGRSEEEVLEEAVARYLGMRRAGRGSGDIEVPEWIASSPENTKEYPRDGFLALIDRMSSRFDLDDPDEAMRIAVQEQHAFRRERAERKREEAER